MTHSPVGILFQTDFNGRVIPMDRLDATFREMLAEHGYALMTNVPDHFDPVTFCRQLGPFVPNYTGAVVGDARPEPDMDDVYHAGNTKPLTPHTESYDFEVFPPRYMLIWDNGRLLHARNAFQDRCHHLRRIQVGSAALFG